MSADDEVKKSTREMSHDKVKSKHFAPKNIRKEGKSYSEKERRHRKSDKKYDQKECSRNILFSPERAKHLDKKDRSKNSPETTKHLDRKEKSSSTGRPKVDFSSGKNSSTGLTLSNQILASYGLDGNHTLVPVVGSNSISESVYASKVSPTSSRREKDPETNQSFEKSATSGKPMDLFGDEETVNASFKISKSAKAKNLERMPESGKPQIVSKRPSASLLALCGLEDSPVKEMRNGNESELGVKSVPVKRKTKLFGESQPEEAEIVATNKQPPISGKGLSLERNKNESKITSISTDDSMLDDKKDKKRNKKKLRLSMSTQSLASFPSKDHLYDQGTTKSEEDQSIKQDRISAEAPMTATPKAVCEAQRFEPQVQAEEAVMDGTNSSEVNKTATTTVIKVATDEKKKKKRVKLSFSSSILASCSPETAAVNKPEEEQCDHSTKTVVLNDSRNVVSEVRITDEKSPLKSLSSVEQQTLRLPTPKKNLASSLGLDLSSSSSESESEWGDEEKSARKVPARAGNSNIPTAVEKVNKVASKREGKSDETVSKPGRKKMKLGHSTKENRIEIIFNN